MENDFLVDSEHLSPAALEKKHRLENDPSSRIDHMKYLEGMDQIDPSLRLRVMKEMAEYDPSEYTVRDVQRALEQENCSVEDLKALDGMIRVRVL